MARAALAAGLVLLGLTAPARTDEAKKAVAQLEGTYRVIGVEKGGTKVTEKMLEGADPKTLRVVFKGDEVTAFFGGKEQTATFVVDPSKSPAHIVITAKKDGKADYGIYKVDGDVLTICVAEDGTEKDRPTEFKADGKVLILTLKKQPNR